MLQQEQEHYQGYQDIPEEEIETRYIYIYDKDPEKRRWPELDRRRIGNRCMQFLALVILVGFCVVQGPPIYQIQTVTVPARFLPVVRLTASAKVVATGIKIIPATHAHGTLTIYNGSILREFLPAGFLVTTQKGIEVATNQAMVIPAANPPAFGVATVPAHTVEAGSQSNVAAGAIYQDDSSSLIIRNLVSFTGGKDASTVHVVQGSDRDAAIAEVKARVEAERPTSELLARPCTETVRQTETQVTVQLDCQYVLYHVLSGARVLSVHVEGNTVIVRLQTVVWPV